jgi:LPXTG-motif cell wall-anchored protein
MSWQAPGYAHRLDLGGGRTGRAVLAVHEETGDLVVIRYLAVESAYFERVRADVAEMSTVDSEYFVGVREVIEHDEGIALVTESVNGANLRHLLRDSGALGAEASLLVFYESLTGLASAHAEGLAHGDYRPENVIIDTSGAARMIDVRAASWVERDITLSTGVYLAPERWRGEEVTAAVDVYASTVTFVEMLAGEPPFWEDSQLIALRYRHEQEAIAVEAIPVELRDIVRLGLAKDATQRADAVALLELVNLTAIAEYGADWIAVGRAQLVELVEQRNLAFGGVAAIDESEVIAAGELVELDDYYADQAAGAAVVGAGLVAASAIGVEQAQTEAVEVDAVEVEAVDVDAVEVDAVEVDAVEVEAVAVESAAGAVAAAEVVAAAAEIVELARIEEMAVAESFVGAEEDVLTEEEELAVAEVSEIVVAVEAAEDDAVVGVAAVGGTAIAATDEELDEFDVVAASGVVFESVVLESESALGAFGEGSVAAGLIAEGVAVEGVAVEGAAVEGVHVEDVLVADVAEDEEGSAAAGVVAGGVLVGGALIGAGAAAAAGSGAGAIAVGSASVPPDEVAVGVASLPPEKVAVGVAAVPPYHRRHPWITGIAAIFLIILCTGGTLAWTGHFPGSNTPSTTSTPVAALTDTPTKQGEVVPPASASPSPSPSDTSNAGVPVTSPSPTAPVASPSSSGGTSTSTATSSPSKHPKPTPSITKLPVTGSTATAGLFGAAAVLLLAGGLLVIVFRRRRA